MALSTLAGVLTAPNTSRHLPRRLTNSDLHNYMPDRIRKQQSNKTITRMAKIRMMAGIAAISGKFGNMYFRTEKRTGRISLCNMPKKNASGLSTKQQAHRERFAAIAKMVMQMRQDGSRKSRKQLWKIAQEAYDAASK